MYSGSCAKYMSMSEVYGPAQKYKGIVFMSPREPYFHLCPEFIYECSKIHMLKFIFENSGIQL